MPARRRPGEVIKESKLSKAAIADWVQMLEHSIGPKTATPDGDGDDRDEQDAPDVTLLPVDAQLQILRQQLEDAFAGVDDRILALAERVGHGEARALAAEARAESADALVGELVASLQQLSRDLRHLAPADDRPELEVLRSFIERVRDRLPTA